MVCPVSIRRQANERENEDVFPSSVSIILRNPPLISSGLHQDFNSITAVSCSTHTLTSLHPRDHPLLPSPPPPSPSEAPPTGRFADDPRSPPPGFKGSPSGRP
ncbi:hypothetical protein C5167_012619 [Papaver somniferum]|uniref:Uncharacterized protein n=1 Tax=Papaver somniferum TaxID=3469 RepID=A0A4Y7J1F6_PAPSO|nr:hypothetical protein C5167_012619 [Papaver somniferum]